MAERLRAFLQRLKGASKTLTESQKLRLEELRSTASEKAANFGQLAEKLRSESIGHRVQAAVTKYENFTGVREVMLLQNNVVAAQERFMAAQDRRRELGREVANIESRLRELHAEMQTTMKGDDKYLHLCTEEHKLILQERSLRQQFSDAEREERERFAEMSSAVKVGHERERAHAERNKYWYIVASVLGTVLGIAGSTVNNHLKMAEFRDMIERQMARSAGVLYTVAGGVGAAGTERNIADAIKTEFEFQEQLANNMKTMQETVAALVGKQASLVDHLNHHEHNIDVQLKELKRLVVTAAKATSVSESELAKVLSIVHHDLEESHSDSELPKNRIVMEPSQIITAVTVMTCLALIIGGVLGRIG